MRDGQKKINSLKNRAMDWQAVLEDETRKYCKSSA